MNYMKSIVGIHAYTEDEYTEMINKFVSKQHCKLLYHIERRPTMSDMLHNEILEDQTCPAVGYQSASICVPVTVTPFAKTGITATKCCGSPVVMPGRNTCGGTKNGSCAFTISQDICVAVPIAFGAVATVGDTFVDCNGASADDICTDCGAVEPKLPIVPVVAEQVNTTEQ